MPDAVTAAQQRLRGRSQWLAAPSSASAVAAGLLAPYYAFLTFDFPPRTTPRYLVISAIGVALFSLGGVLWEQYQLRTLRGMASGALEPSKENLLRAVREVAGAPDRNLRISLNSWLFIPIGAAVAFKLTTAGVSWELFVRLSAMGVVIGPLASVLLYFLFTTRARTLVSEVASLGLSSQEVAQVIPARRSGLRMRFIAYTAMAFITPCALTADVALTLGHKRWEATLARIDPAQQRQVAQEMSGDAATSVMILSGVSILLALATAFVAGRAMGAPLQKIAREASRMASGDLGEGEVILAEDDAWVVSASFSAMRAYLVDVLAELRRAGIQVSASAQSLLTTSADQEGGATLQAAALNQTSATTDALARSAAETSQTAQAVSELASRTLATATAGQEGVQTFLSAVARIRSDNEAIATAVETLNGKVQQIGRIVESIRGLADRSDLLAVNAELEGTRAGEVGRGFSLVATELRRLAESVLGATHDIEQRIDEIREGTQEAVEATNVSVRATEIGAELAAEMSESFRRVLALSERTSESIHSISLATVQQQDGAVQLSAAMADILRATEETGGVTRQMSAASQDLSKLSRTLEEAVGRFRFGAREGSAS